jgi:hypothetical protein
MNKTFSVLSLVLFSGLGLATQSQAQVVVGEEVINASPEQTGEASAVVTIPQKLTPPPAEDDDPKGDPFSFAIKQTDKDTWRRPKVVDANGKVIDWETVERGDASCACIKDYESYAMDKITKRGTSADGFTHTYDVTGYGALFIQKNKKLKGFAYNTYRLTNGPGLGKDLDIFVTQVLVYSL